MFQLQRDRLDTVKWQPFFKEWLWQFTSIFLTSNFTYVVVVFLVSIVVSIPACHAGDRGSIPRRGGERTGFILSSHCQNKDWTTFGEGNGTPLQYFCLEKPMDGGALQAAVHEVTKSRTRLNDFTFTFHFHALEKEMSTHSSILAWRIPGTGSWWAAVYGVTQSRTQLTWLSSSKTSYKWSLQYAHV